MAGENNQVKWRGVQPVGGIAGVWPAIDSGRLYASAFNNGNLTVEFYAVPAGKKAFITNAVMGFGNNAAAVASGYLAIRDTGNTLTEFLAYMRFSAVGQLFGVFQFHPAIEMPAGYDIVIVSNSVNLLGRAIVRGWVEDV